MDTYEKKYNEALELAREKRDIASRNGADITVKFLEEIFPELRESEDERIRKEMIDFLKSEKAFQTIDLPKSERWLAYLEKQKEQKPNQSEEEREYVKTLKGLVSDFIRDSGGAISDVTYYQRICDWLDERHIEQKPAEYLDKDKVYATMKKLHDLSFSQLIPINSDEYKKIDEITCDIRNFLNYPIEQKPDWSEEDEKIIDTIVSVLGQYIDYKAVSGTGTGYATPRYSKEIAWLKSLRPQPKQEWSEDDKEMLDAMIDIVSGSFYEPLCPRKEMLAWLKSLRPSWKPSEEQMEALQCAIAFMEIRKASDYDISPLKSLYEKLKKL